MSDYECEFCGMIIKEDVEGKTVICPECGYTMSEIQYDRKEIMLKEIARFVDGVTETKIDENNLIPFESKSYFSIFLGKERFYEIKHYILEGEEPKDFKSRVLESVDNIRSFIHFTVKGTYRAKDNNNHPIKNRSDYKVKQLKKILPLLGIDFEPDPAKFPEYIIYYTDTPNRDILPYVDDLLDRCSGVAEKIEEFINVNNLCVHSYDVKIALDLICSSFIVGMEKQFDVKSNLKKRIADCDEIINKRYTVDSEEDGLRQLEAMLKVFWIALYLLMLYSKKATRFTYRFYDPERGLNGNKVYNPEQAVRIMKDIYVSRFAPVRDAVHSRDFLADKSEAQIFVIYSKLLDFDENDYMTDSRVWSVAGENEKKLNELIGLETVKKSIEKIKAYAVCNKDCEDFNLHMCFLGNPGTGKTEVARLIAGILNENGVLPTDKVIETDRGGLIAGHVGQTEKKTKEKIEKAMGGVLFIDEAYSLYVDRIDFGYEAIATLIKAMEDSRGKFCVIVAGYKNRMEEMLSSNPGFKSRIQFTLEFPNYSRSELGKIARLMLEKKGYSASDEAVERILDITDVMRKDPDFANARTVRNIIEHVIMNQNQRMLHAGKIKDRDIILSDVTDYISDEGIDMTAGTNHTGKIGF